MNVNTGLKMWGKCKIMCLRMVAHFGLLRQNGTFLEISKYSLCYVKSLSEEMAGLYYFGMRFGPLICAGFEM